MEVTIEERLAKAKASLLNPAVSNNPGLRASMEKKVKTIEAEMGLSKTTTMKEPKVKIVKKGDKNVVVKKKGTEYVEKKKKVVVAGAPKEKSVMFMVNLLHHQGMEKEKIIQKLGITSKKYSDCQWHYKNSDYKSKIVKYLKEGGK